MSSGIVKFIKSWTFTIILFAVLTAVNITVAIVYEEPAFSLLVSMSEIIFVALLSDRSIISFIVSVFNIAIYVILAFQVALYGEVIYYLFIDLPTTVISCVLWIKVLRKYKRDRRPPELAENAVPPFVSKVHMMKPYSSDLDKNTTVQTRRLKWYWYPPLIIAVGMLTWGYGVILTVMGDAAPYWDALSTVVSIAACLLLIFRYAEQWIMWIIGYVIAIILWLETDEPVMVVSAVSCILFCIKGVIEWYTQNKNDKVKR